MKNINQIFEKIKNFLNKLFRKKDILLLVENNIQQEEIIEDNKQEEKEEFFELYENVKKGIVSLDDLMITELIKILSISQEELNIKDREGNKIEIEIAEMNKEINMLKREKNIYLEKMYSNN